MATLLDSKTKAQRLAEVEGELVILRERKASIEARLLELTA